MLKKEISDALKRWAESLLFLLAIPVTFAFDRFVIKSGMEFSELTLAVAYFTLFFFSIYAGVSIFQSEKKDRAFEYLFSLPVSKLKILLYKILPRFILLGLMIVLFLVLMEPVFYNPLVPSLGSSLEKVLFFVLLYVFFFFLSVILSIAFSSVVMAFIGVCLLAVLRTFAGRTLDFIVIKAIHYNFPRTFHFNQYLSAALLLIPIGIAFWITFKNMDVKPFKLQMKKYYIITISTIVILTTFVIVFFKKYLTWLMELR
jgi:ABC-type transport system involved in multi-copper enzyme maturation permease subunit